MTTEELVNMEYPLGMPLAWIFTPGGEVIVDYDGRPLARYLMEFEYVYDEESDDRCDMKFQFDHVTKFDLPYFKNDIVLLVQWGFITPGGKAIKSPKLKVAVRDISTSYSDKGLTLSLECTDLLAYLKAYKTTTIRKYANPNAAANIARANILADNFIDYVKEVAEGRFTATVSTTKKAVTFDIVGGTTVSDVDPRTGLKINSTRDNTALDKKFVQEFFAGKVIKGKSQTIDRTMRQLLEGMGDPATGQKYQMDSTGDHLNVRPRFFNQPPFKTFHWNAGKRNFISFKNKSDTRKIEEDIVKNSGVNPYTKEVDSTEISVADTRDKPESVLTPYEQIQKEVQAEMDSKNKPTEKEKMDKVISKVEQLDLIPPPEPTPLPDLPKFTQFGVSVKEIQTNVKIQRDPGELEGELKRYAEKGFEIYSGNVLDTEQMLNHKELEDHTYFNTVRDARGRFKTLEKASFTASDILGHPDFQSIAEEKASDFKKAAIRAQGLIGHAIEKIQRKYEASATVMGDPSLVKARTYDFFGLSETDSGRWYCTSVSHKINRGNGYLCDMDLIKKPMTVGLSQINYKEKRTLLEGDEILELNRYVSQKGTTKFSDEEKAVFNEPEPMTEQQEIEGMSERVNTLNAEEDYTIE